MATSLPTITLKQQDILNLLYSYRFLDRIQLQRLMGHKAKQPAVRLLQDLRSKQYVDWMYSTNFTEKTKPAIYYLGRNGIRYLRTQAGFPPLELSKRNQEPTQPAAFIEACRMTANVTIELAERRGGVSYTWTTAAGCALPDSPFAGARSLHPSLCIIRYERIGSRIDSTPFLLEICSPTTYRNQNRRRLHNYVSYLEEGAWEGTFPAKPIMLVVCPDKSALRGMKRYGRQLLDEYGQADCTYFRFTTFDSFKTQGIRARIWEAA